MKTTKIIIGTGILAGAAAIAYVLVKRSKAAPEVDTGSGSSPLPVVVSSPPSNSQPRMSKYPEGTLLTDSTEYVFIIDAQGYRHWIPNWTVFNRMSLQRSDIKKISNSEMQSIPRLNDLGGLGKIIF